MHQFLKILILKMSQSWKFCWTLDEGVSGDQEKLYDFILLASRGRKERENGKKVIRDFLKAEYQFSFILAPGLGSLRAKPLLIRAMIIDKTTGVLVILQAL